MGKSYTYPPEFGAMVSEALRQRYADPAAREVVAKARRGKPSRGGHVTNHVKRGVVNPDCIFCKEEQEQRDGDSDA